MSNISFEQIYKDYKDKLLTTVSKRLNDTDEAEDLVQECMIKIYENLSKYDSKYALSTWVYTIAFNIINDHYRSKGKTPKLTTVSQLYDNEHTVSHDSPENILISEQTKTKTDHAIASMSKELLDVYTLKDVDGMQLKDIAAHLSIPLNTVKSRLRRAREGIKAAIV